MRKVLKWIGIVLGGLIGLLIVAIVGLVIYGNLNFHKHVDRPVYEIKADTSPEGVARGEYLVRDVVGCQGCHGPKVEQGQTPDRDAPLAGHTEDVSFGPIQAAFNTPNLTPDPETGLANWSDGEIARAIREGLAADGTALAVMPASAFQSLSDADVSAIVGYLRSLEPVHNAIPPFDANAFGKVALSIGLFEPPNPQPQITAAVTAPQTGTVEMGKYMASLGGCAFCHGENLAGGSSQDSNSPPAANLTPAGELAGWSEADFINTIRTGVNPAGRQLSDSMPWKELSHWHDEDLAAVFKYLQSLPPAQSK